MSASDNDSAQPANTTSPVLIIVIAVMLAVAGIAAFIIAGSGSDEAVVDASSDAASAEGPTPSDVIATVSGEVLTQYSGNPDPAVGASMPVATGTNFVGETVSIAPTGQPQAILFLAHWCSHCQREVPAIQSWIDGGGLPEGTELVSVATAIDPAAPNYPPEAWLESEGWTTPVIVDRSNDISLAFGLSAFPFWVFVDGDGNVVSRQSGELGGDQLDAILSAIG